MDLGLNLLFSRLPYVVSKYRSPRMVSAIAAEINKSRYDLLVCDFLTPSINLPTEQVTQRRIPALLFQHNVEARVWKRLAENTRNPLKHLYVHSQHARLKRYEGKASGCFDAVVTVSDDDAAVMRQDYGLPNVVGSVPTGVDVGFFGSALRAPIKGHVVFVGSMDWMPNIDGINWFMMEIWPRIIHEYPGASLSIVGRRPTHIIRAWERRFSHVRVTGDVPDIRPYLANAHIVVVPLRVGSGTRIKIYEAMAAGAPVLSTTIGAEGLGVTAGNNILIADTPEQFAGEAVRIMRNPALCDFIASNGCRLVRDHFSWHKVACAFESHCSAAIDTAITRKTTGRGIA